MKTPNWAVAGRVFAPYKISNVEAPAWGLFY